MIKNEEKRPWTHLWSYLIVEGYCLIDMDYNHKKNKFCYDVDPKDPQWNHLKEIPNPDYDPTVKQNKLPIFCKKRVCKECISNMCKYFGSANPEDEILKSFRKHMKKQFEKQSKRS